MARIGPEVAKTLVAVGGPGLGRIRRARPAERGAWLLLTTVGVFRVDPRSSDPPCRLRGPAEDVARSGTGRTVVADRAVRAWDATEHLLDEVAGFSARALAWSPDGTRIASGWAEDDTDWTGGGLLRVVDERGAPSWQAELDGWASAVAWGAGPIAVGTSTGSVVIHGEDGERRHTLELEGLSPYVAALEWEGARLFVLSVHDDFVARLTSWDGTTLEVLFEETVAAHAAVALGPGPRLAFVPGEGSKLDPDRPHLVRPDGSRKRGAAIGPVDAMTFRGDAELAIVGGSGLRVLDATTAKAIRKRPLVRTPLVEGLAMSLDGERFVTWGREPTLHFWATREARRIREVELPARTWAAVFLPDGRVALGAGDELLFVSEAGALARTPMKDVRVLGLLGDGCTLALRSHRDRVSHLVLIDLVTGRHRELRGGQGAVAHAERSADGSLLLVGTGGGRALVFAFADASVRREIDVDLRAGSSLHFVGEHLVWSAPGDDHRTYPFRVAAGLDDPGADVPGVRGVARALPSPDGSRVLAIGERGWLVQPATRRVIATVPIGGRAAFSPDGGILAGVADLSATELLLFDRDGAPLASHPVGMAIDAIAFSPDGSHLAVATLNGEVRVFRAP